MKSVFSPRDWEAVLYRELRTREHIMVVWTKTLSPTRDKAFLGAFLSYLHPTSQVVWYVLLPL